MLYPQHAHFAYLDVKWSSLSATKTPSSTTGPVAPAHYKTKIGSGQLLHTHTHHKHTHTHA